MGDQYAFYHINQKKCKYFGFSEWEIYYRDLFVVTYDKLFFMKNEKNSIINKLNPQSTLTCHSGVFFLSIISLVYDRPYIDY
jgi:hypothetical protein